MMAIVVQPKLVSLPAGFLLGSGISSALSYSSKEHQQHLTKQLYKSNCLHTGLEVYTGP